MTENFCSNPEVTPRWKPERSAVCQVWGGILVYTLDETVQFNFASDSYCEMTGYSCAALTDLLAQIPQTIVPSEDVPVVQEAMKLLHGEECCLTIDYRLLRKDGCVRCMHDIACSARVENDKMRIFAFSQDVTAQLEHEKAQEAETRALRENEKFLRAFMTLSDRVTARYDIAEKVLEFEAEYVKKSGMLARYENVPEYFVQSGEIFSDTLDEYMGLFAEIASGKSQGRTVLHLKTHGGEAIWCEVRYSIFFDQDNRPQTAVLSFLNVTSQRDREIVYQRYVQEVEGARADNRAYIEVNLSTDFIEKQGAGMLLHNVQLEGKSYTEALKRMLSEFAVDEDAVYATFSRDHLLTVFADGITTVQEELAVRAYEGDGWISCQVQMVADPFTQAVRAYLVLLDVTREKRLNLELQKRAEQDGMTEVYNRATAETLIRCAMAERPGRSCALIVLDIDDLKSINDRCGHIRGDAVIRSVAEILRGFFRGTDIVGRIGGDEFMVFVKDAPEESVIRRKLEKLALRLSSPGVDGGEAPSHCSVGCAMGTCGQDDFDTLYNNADSALYHVKRHGKHGCAIFERDMKRKKQ